jgi:CubicO group peptidase (beta-lactamase class C family)
VSIKADSSRSGQGAMSIAELGSLIAHVASQNQFSGAVRVTVGTEVAASAAFGYADRSQRVDNTPDTRFGSASGTKLFTALAIGALIDDGRLALDASLRAVVPFDLPGVSDGVTIEHLLTHTSGVYDYYDEELIDDLDSFDLSIPAHKLRRPRDYLPMVVGGEMKFTPGERFSYSNGGYVLLGVLIEALTGDYHRFIESRIMHRAGMHSSRFFRLDQLPAQAAIGYTAVDDPSCTNVHSLPVIGGPDGGAFVTASDMEHLWRALFAREILTPALTRTFTQKAVRSSGSTYYGHGLWIRDEAGEPPIIYVMGSDPGVSFSSRCHGGNIIATVASNTSDGAWPMVRAIDDFIREKFSTAAREFD